MQTVLKQVQHIRVRPISIKRPITVPAGRPKPIQSTKSIITRPSPAVKIVAKPKALPKLQHRIVSKQRPAPPVLHKDIPTTKSGLQIAQYKGIGHGKSLVIIANGPSHKLAQLDKLKDIPGLDIMCVNKPDSRVWPTTYWTFCDNSQYHRHIDLWNSFTGIVFNTPSVIASKFNVCKVKHVGQKQFSLDLNVGLHIGNSSTFAAMQIANWMNYDKVYVFGLDMGAIDGKLYAWGTNPDVSDQVRAKRFAVEAVSYQWAADHSPPHVLDRFVICSEYNKWPFMKAFKRLPCRDAVDHILGIMSSKVHTTQEVIPEVKNEVLEEEKHEAAEKQQIDSTSNPA